VPQYTLVAVKRELSNVNPDGEPTKSSLRMLRMYLREKHRRWWKVVGGESRPKRWIPQWQPPEKWSEDLRQGGQGEYLPHSDYWGPDRWQPSGAHPEDVRATPQDYVGVIEDTEPPPASWRPTAREAEETHSQDWRECPACGQRGRDILGSCDSSPTERARFAPPKGQRRWTQGAAAAAFERRMARAVRPVDMGDEPTRKELGKFWLLRHRAEQCSTSVAILQRHAISAGDRIERLAVPLRCRTRECLRCSVFAGQYAARRMEFQWTQLLTLTLRQDQCSEAHAWRWVSRWVSKLMTRLQMIARKGVKQCGCWSNPERKDHAEIVLSGDKLTYCWVIEPHKKGWPHVHIAWDARYVCFDRVRELWWEITGIRKSGSWVVKVGSTERIPNYLVKYLTKGTFSTKLLAYMFRRRIWASNVRRTSQFESGYQLIDVVKGADADRAVDVSGPPLTSKESFWAAKEHHWTFLEGANGKYNSWYISGQISDIAVSCMRDDVAEKSKERAEYEWEREMHRLRLKSRYGVVFGGRLEEKYLDREDLLMKRCQQVMAGRDKDGKSPGLAERACREPGRDSALRAWILSRTGASGAPATVGV